MEVLVGPSSAADAEETLPRSGWDADDGTRGMVWFAATAASLVPWNEVFSVIGGLVEDGGRGYAF